MVAERPASTAWAHAQLLRLGYGKIGPTEVVCERPWSIVWKTTTERGTVWIKKNSPSLVIEGRLIKRLAEWTPTRVPEPLAVDDQHCWMLLSDAGRPLPDLLKGDPNLRHWELALADYGQMQFDLSDRSADLLAIGVPDCRPEVTADQLSELLEDKPTIMPDGAQGISKEEFEQLRALQPEFSRGCNALAEIGIAPSLQHDDLWEANIFLGDNGYVFIDWPWVL